MENDTGQEPPTVRDGNYYAQQALIEAQIPTQGYPTIPGEAPPFDVPLHVWMSKEAALDRKHKETMATIQVGGHMGTAKVVHQSKFVLAKQLLDGHLDFAREARERAIWDHVRKQGVHLACDGIKYLIFGPPRK